MSVLTRHAHRALDVRRPIVSDRIAATMTIVSPRARKIEPVRHSDRGEAQVTDTRNGVSSAPGISGQPLARHAEHRPTPRSVATCP